MTRWVTVLFIRLNIGVFGYLVSSDKNGMIYLLSLFLFLTSAAPLFALRECDVVVGKAGADSGLAWKNRVIAALEKSVPRREPPRSLLTRILDTLYSPSKVFPHNTRFVEHYRIVEEPRQEETIAGETAYVDYKGVRLETAQPEGRLVFHAESPFVKPMNDRAFLGSKPSTDIVVGKLVESTIEELGPKSLFSRDLKTQLTAEQQNALIQASAAHATEKFQGWVESVAGLKAYLESQGINPDKLLTIGWAKASTGKGHGDVAAAIAVRISRKEGRKSWASYEEVIPEILDVYKGIQKTAAEMRENSVFQGLLNKDKPGLDEGVYAKARSLSSNEELRQRLNLVYRTSFTASHIEILRKYIESVDLFSAPIFQEKPGKLPWAISGATLTVDYVGGGAENSAVLEQEILQIPKDASDHADKIIEASRRAEQKVTANMKAAIRDVEETIGKVLKRKGYDLNAFGSSADDMLAVLPAIVAHKPALFREMLNEIPKEKRGRLRMTLLDSTYQGQPQEIPVPLKQKINGALEKIHKAAMGIAETNGVPPLELKNLLVPTAQVDRASGTVSISLTSNLDEIESRILSAFRQAIDENKSYFEQFQPRFVLSHAPQRDRSSR